MSAYVIRYNKDRYSDMMEDPPELITVVGTLYSAHRIVTMLSDYYPGCDDIFFVEPSGDRA